MLFGVYLHSYICFCERERETPSTHGCSTGAAVAVSPHRTTIFALDPSNNINVNTPKPFPYPVIIPRDP